MAKNLALWLLSGELVPLDLLPETYKNFMLALPFANAVYIPVGYITGRISVDLIYHGFYTTTVGLLVMGVISALMWKWGMSKYVGTGA